MSLLPLKFDFQSETPAGLVKISARTGQIVHIWGSSGAGKTTLLCRIWGSRSIGRGSLQVDVQGQKLDLGRMSPARFSYLRPSLMAYVSQNPNVLPRVRMSDWFSTANASRLNEGLRHLDLSPDLLHRCAADLSGGELQRFVLLRAFFSRAPILLLDEPCTGLDPERHGRVVTLLKTARNEQKLVIYTSHVHEPCIDQSIKLNE